MIRKILFLFALSFVLFSCGDDNDDRTVLNYDGNNIDAPALFAGDYTAIVRFPASDLSNLVDGQLEEVDFWIADIPSTLTLQVFGEGDGNSPGSLLHSENIILRTEANDWNNISLNTPVNITGEELWVGFEFRLDDFARVIGCDAGPAIENGDLMNDESGNWTTLRNYSNGEVDINWNIRAYVRP